MKGALTYKDLDRLKRKAPALDKIREYLRESSGRDDEVGLQSMLETAYEEDRVTHAKSPPTRG